MSAEVTVGRIVYFKEELPYFIEGEPSFVIRAAIVTAVYDDNTICLNVQHPSHDYKRSNVTQGEEPGQWDWMPYQVDRAKKDAIIDKAVLSKPKADK